MDLLSDKEHSTRPGKCCIKRVKRNMDSNHSFLRDGSATLMVATRAERIRHSEHWILKLNQDGPRQPLIQRPDFAQAKRECNTLHDEYMARTQQEYRTIPWSQQVRQRKEQQFEGIEEYDNAVDRRTGWRFYKPARGNLSLSSPSSSSTNWESNHWTTRSWNSWHSSRSDHSSNFSQIGPLSVGREINFPTTDGGCRQNPLARHICARTAHHRTQCTSTVTHYANTRGSTARSCMHCCL